MFSSSSSSSFEDDAYMDIVVDTSMEYLINYVTQNPIPRIADSRRYYERNREMGHAQLMNDYFCDNPVYPKYMFRRRFRMRRHVFLRLVQALEARDPYFQQRVDATGRMGISALQKCTAALRMLAYGEASDRVDEYLRLSESTARLSLQKFTNGIVEIFGSEYMRSPTVDDLQRLLQIGEQRGLPGMMGSIGCMHWQWKNCPVAWKGQFQGRSGKATVVLEAVASQDLWIWHSFFGIPGTCNDITVLQRSPLFDDLLNGRAPRVNFVLNNQQYDMGYYLTDGIYPKWSTFIPSIPLPQTPKNKLFSERQESTRKDVERAFGVIQARFAVIRRPALSWDEGLMNKIITCCIILHNMIVEDERDSYGNYQDPNDFNEYEGETSIEEPLFQPGYIAGIQTYVANRNRARDTNKHVPLKRDLVEHIWQKFGANN